MKHLLLTLIIPTIAFAEIPEVSTGEIISTEKINTIISKLNDLENKIFPVGTMIHSILQLEQFQLENGDCWKKLDGSPLNESDDLKSFGYLSLPNAESKFLKNSGVDSAGLGQAQEDSIKAHNHIDGFPRADGYRYVNSTYAGTIVSGSGYVSTNTNDLHTRRFAYSSTTGSTEIRPKNLTVNMFIKFKKVCNFN